MSVQETGLFYIFIYSITTLLAFLSQKKVSGGYVCNAGFLFVSFLIHWIFLAFTNTGSDYDNYYRIVQTPFDELFEVSEPVFTGLGSLFTGMFGNPDISIFCIKTLTVILLYICFYKIRKRTSLGLAILAYNSFLLLQGMLVIAQHLAVVLFFLSILLLLENRNKLSIFLIILACFVHNSVFIILLIYPVYYYFHIRKKIIPLFIIFLIALVIGIVLNSLSELLTYILFLFPIFDHYSSYDMILDYEGTGLMQYIFFIPIFYYVYKIYKSSSSNRMKNISILLTFMAFTCALVGYRIEVFSRMNAEFLVLYAYIIPLHIETQRGVKNLVIRNGNFIWFIYLVIRAYLVFSVNMNIDSGGELYKYNFFNPFL